ncbi:MAG: hypothetical protein ACYCZY_13175 [Lacisediminihabitans sp.]
MSIDTSEVRQLAADMRRVPERLNRWVIPVLERGANNIKKQLRDEMAASLHFKVITPAIGYDVLYGGFGDAGTYEVEIGPSAEPGSAGNLANIAYFGGAHGGGGTVPDPQAALDAEAPKFEKALGDLLEDLL